MLDERSFRRMLSLERKRTERSRKPFLLMLLQFDPGAFADSNRIFTSIVSAVSATTRETDVVGWYESPSIIGVMFTEITLTEKKAILSPLLARIRAALRDKLGPEQFRCVGILLCSFPNGSSGDSEGRPNNPTFYPELVAERVSNNAKRRLKRLMDIGGSLFALAVLSPVLLIVAAAVRFSSEGPVLFRQHRVGQYGTPFSLLKFRSMHSNNDPTIHREYVTRLVTGTAERQAADGTPEGVYKLTRDPRVTRVGAILRRLSLDELPQLLNVLRGDMSLVGPRPPLPYEVDVYDLWHRRRLMEAKPGITGLWQVSGRNRIAFDDMVRLDLQYARTWSVWLDLKILLRTPLAVIEGAH